MKIKSQNQLVGIIGLSFGLMGTLFGLSMSSAIELTPVLMGTVAAVWCAVSAAIIGGSMKK